MDPNLKEVLSHFQTEGAGQSCQLYVCGQIYDTYLAVTDTGRRYILQKLSNRAFPDIAGLQENVEAVTLYFHLIGKCWIEIMTITDILYQNSSSAD